MAIGSDKESGNPPVPTTAVEQQTLPKSFFTPLPLKRKILYVSERVNLKRAPKKEWYNVFVLNNAALHVPKRSKLEHEASTIFSPIHLIEPNTPTPIEISEDELTEIKGVDTDSNLPIITLSKVSTSLEASSLDPVRDVPRSDLSREVRLLYGNRS